jgi:hypothetical protein
MDRITPEIAEEILVLFKHENVHALAREEKSEHDAGRPAAHDAAGRLFDFHRRDGFHIPVEKCRPATVGTRRRLHVAA